MLVANVDGQRDTGVMADLAMNKLRRMPSDWSKR